MGIFSRSRYATKVMRLFVTQTPATDPGEIVYLREQRTDYRTNVNAALEQLARLNLECSAKLHYVVQPHVSSPPARPSTGAQMLWAESIKRKVNAAGGEGRCELRSSGSRNRPERNL